METKSHPQANLTERQTLIVQRFAKGEAMKAIAADLGVSEKTIEYHLTQARLKIFGTTGVAAQVLTLWAVREKLVEP